MKQIRLLLATMLAFVFTAGAWAQTFTSGSFTYTIKDGSAYVTKVVSGLTTVSFPTAVTNTGTGISYTVRGFSTSAVLDNLHCDTWTSVTFPQYFTNFYIKYESGSTETVWASRYFSNAISIVFAIDSNLAFFPDEAFDQCSKLQMIQLPYGTTRLGFGCFGGCQSLTTIYNTDNITYIGEKAFWGCTSLTSISLPKVKHIYTETFNHCSSLASVTLGECQTIGESAFSNCTSLNTISLPNTLTFIGDNAFSHFTCSEITFPASLLYIGKGAFNKISKINIEGERVLPVHPSFICYTSNNVTVNVVAGTIPTYKKLEGWSADRFNFVETGEKTIKVRTNSNRVIDIRSGSEQLTTFTSENGEVTLTVTVPQELEFRVPGYAFKGFYVDGVAKSYSYVEPTSSQYAGYRFYTVPIVSGMESIEIRYNPISQESISFADPLVQAACVTRWDTNHDRNLNYSEAGQVWDFPAGVIGAEVTSFNEFWYFSEVRVLEEGAFQDCEALTSITLPQKLGRISENCFKGDAQLEVIDIPQSVMAIDHLAFDGCSSLQSIFIPKDLTTLAYNALNNCVSLSSISVDKNNTKYDSRGGCNAIIYTSNNRIVAGCKNTRIPDDIEAIWFNAFKGATGLTSIELPATLTAIKEEAFYGCSGLTSVVAKMQDPTIVTLETDAFTGISDDCVLTVPTGTRNAYINAGWTEDIFKGGIVEAAPEAGDIVTATIIPGNNEYLVFQDSEGNDLYGGNEVKMQEMTRGGSYKLLVSNTFPGSYNMRVYVNDDERTTELVSQDGWEVLNLDNVTENMLIRVEYTAKQLKVPTIASVGGSITAHFTNTNDNEVSRSILEGTGTIVDDVKPSTPITFTFQPEQGYELGLVFCNYNRMDTEEVQSLSDGTYQFVLPANQVVNEKTTVVALFKKTGTDVNYDVNGDGFITIADAVLIVNEILNQ